MRRRRATGKCRGKLLDGCLPYRILHMQIVFCHVHIGMTYDTLDGGKVNTQSLHLGYIGVTAAVGRQNPDFFHVFQGLLELVPEVGRVAGHSGLLYRHLTAAAILMYLRCRPWALIWPPSKAS